VGMGPPRARSGAEGQGDRGADRPTARPTAAGSGPGQFRQALASTDARDNRCNRRGPPTRGSKLQFLRTELGVP